MKKIVLRVDAGQHYGFGHAIRSISLARHLRDSFGIQPVFFSRYHDKLEKLYQENKFNYIFSNVSSEEEILNAIKESYSGDVLFIDKLYPFSRRSIRNLRDRLKIIMFHNECDGMYESDYAIFPSAHLSPELVENSQWMYANAKLLHGPDYILINDKVIQFLSQAVPTDPAPSIAITTGANDPKGILIQLLKWLNESDVNFKVNALVGFDFSGWNELKEMMPALKQTIRVNKYNLKDLFSSTIVISTFGVTTYELIYAGIPVATIGHIKKNAMGGEILQKRYGCNYHLGLFKELSKSQFISMIEDLWKNKKLLSEIKKNQNNMIDGKGIQRIGHIVSDLCTK